ncbi:MAG: hypothetical protein Tsb005_07460 [Gammaproteobacteria bacterium]
MKESLLNEQLLQLLLHLFLVIVLIFAVAYIARRYFNKTINPIGPLSIVASLSLGLKEKLVLIQVADKQILLSISPGRITKIHLFEQPIITAETANKSILNFSQQLQHIMRKQHK